MKKSLESLVKQVDSEQIMKQESVKESQTNPTKTIVSLCLVIDDLSSVRKLKMKQINLLLNSWMLTHRYQGFVFGADNAATAQAALEKMKISIEQYKDDVIFMIVVLTDRNFFLKDESNASRSLDSSGKAEKIVLEAFDDITGVAKTVMSISSAYDAASDDKQVIQQGDNNVEPPQGMTGQLIKKAPLMLSQQQIATPLIKALKDLSASSARDERQPTQPGDDDVQPTVVQQGLKNQPMVMNERQIVILLTKMLKKLSVQQKPSDCSQQPSSQAFDASVISKSICEVKCLKTLSCRRTQSSEHSQRPDRLPLVRSKSDGWSDVGSDDEKSLLQTQLKR
ncbi:MAG: hypothetical protein GKR77_01805 [Legionellales bacterium]|nr:hypothetical protein [Legionellales bacterium]